MGVGAVGAGAAAAVVGVVRVEVVVMVAVVEPIFICCSIRTAAKVLYCLIGVMRGA